MNSLERINLEKMITTNNVIDETENIRQKKHSKLIKDNVDRLIDLKKKYIRLEISNPNEFEKLCISRCSFLFNNYTDIFNKIKKNELNLNILFNFLSVLKEIEDGNIDQHEGSFQVGKLLKEMYIDSALKKSEKLDSINNKKKPKKPLVKERNISWKEFKEQNNN